MAIADTLAKDVGVKSACNGLAIARATYYRWKNKCGKPEKKYIRPPLALSSEENQQVLDILHDRQFIDMAPQEVYFALLDGGSYLCSVRTMYRILKSHKEVRERRDQLRHISYAKPELLAEEPNKVWSFRYYKT